MFEGLISRINSYFEESSNEELSIVISNRINTETFNAHRSPELNFNL